MKFTNFRIAIKLTIGFGLVMILAGLLALYCWFSIKNLTIFYRKSDNQKELLLINSNNTLLLTNYTKNSNASTDKQIRDNFVKSNEIINFEVENEKNKNNKFWIQSSEKNKEIENLYNELNQLIKQLQNAESTLQNSENELINLTKLESSDINYIYIKQFQNYRNSIKFSGDFNSEELYQNIINPIKNKYPKNKNIEDIIFQLQNNFKTLNNNSISIYNKLNELNEKINEFENYCKTNQISISGKSDSIFKEITITLIIITFIAAVLAVIIAEYIKFGLSRGVKKVVGYSRKVAEGDLTINVDEKYLNRRDEIGDLSKAMNVMILKLREIVSNVITNSQNISNASEEMSSNSQQVSQGASEQASSAEEVSSSVQEMTSNIQQNTENAVQTEKIAVKAAIEIKEASNNVNTTVEAMKEIFSKVSIISEIAFQTNILALNAAVEAARAGEHGKGFAVVASEVRKLAERSQEAATEINELSKTTVDSAITSGELLSKLVPDIQKTAKLVQEIASGSMEQNTGAEQINTAIQQLNQVIQQNAAAAEEMATSSEELEAQSQQMLETVNYFKTGEKLNFKTEQKKKANLASEQKITSFKPKTNKGFNLNLGKSDNIDNEYERF